MSHDSKLEAFVLLVQQTTSQPIRILDVNSLLMFPDYVTDEPPSAMWLVSLASLLHACHLQIDKWIYLTDRIDKVLKYGAKTIVELGCAQACVDAMAEISSEFVNVFPLGQVQASLEINHVIPNIDDRDEFIGSAIGAVQRFEEFGCDDCSASLGVVSRWLKTPRRPAASANAICSLLNSWYGPIELPLYQSDVFRAFQNDLTVVREHFRRGERELATVFDDNQMSWMKETFDPE
ncbi:MAG: hypothetical protein R3C18_09605 [Planctomycetaceae bacterium]